MNPNNYHTTKLRNRRAIRITFGTDTTYDIRHASCSIEDYLRHTTYDIRHLTYDLRHTDLQHTTYDI